MKLTLPPLSSLLTSARAYAVHGGALVLIGVIGWIVGSSAGNPRNAELRGADNVVAPAWQRFEAGPARARALEIVNFIRDASEEVPVAAAAPATKPDDDSLAKPDDAWRFIGTAIHGGDTVAFIVVGKPSKLVVVSKTDPLPNGEQIVGIEQDRLRYVKDGQSMEAALFERKKK